MGGKNSGRNRTVCPPDEELVKLGKELVKWCESGKKSDKFHLKQWWCIEKKMLQRDWDAIRKQEFFLPYYEQARAHISIKYIDGTVNPSIAHRFLRLYFLDLREDEDSLLRFKAEVSAKELKGALTKEDWQKLIGTKKYKAVTEDDYKPKPRRDEEAETENEEIEAVLNE